MAKRKSVSQLKKLADKHFSIYIRQRDRGICYTCHKRDEWKYMDCGHYVPRSFNNTRYDEVNCHTQCKSCNIFKSGNKDVYALRLQQEYGYGVLKDLNDRKNVRKSFKRYELEEIIEEYKGMEGYE